MICRSTIRKFDGDVSTTLHTAIVPLPGVVVLRFIAFTVIDKASGRYVDASISGPEVVIAWAPRELVADETSSPSQIDAALANPDHVPLLVVEPRSRPCGYCSDNGAGFPAVAIKGTPMVLLVRLESITPGTHGQITFGWQTSLETRTT